MSTKVGLDIGRRNTKVIAKGYADIFVTTAMIKNNKFDNDNCITCIGNKYLVGHDEGNAIYNDDKSKDTTFEICLYNALSKIDDTNFSVVTGLPINHYKLYRDALEEKYTGKVITIEDSNGKLKTIKIEKLTVRPEGVLCVDISDEEDTLIIDIGGLTVDVAQYKDLKLNKAMSFELGVRIMYANIADELNKEYGTDYTIDDIERYIQKGYIVYDNDIHEFDFTPYILNHLQKIIITIKDNFAWKRCLKRFVGGGATVFSEILLQAKLEVSNVAIYANAIAFYEEAEKIG